MNFKLMTLFSFIVLSSNAFSFSEVTLNTEVTAKKKYYVSPRIILHESFNLKGTKGCTYEIASTDLDSTIESILIPNGTTFKVDQNSIVNDCSGGVFGKTFKYGTSGCALGLKAVNEVEKLNMNIVCHDISAIPVKFSLYRINKYKELTWKDVDRWTPVKIL